MADNLRVVASFADRHQATAAVQALRAAGFADSQIGVLARDTRTGLPNDPTGTRWEEGTGIGAAAGAATGLGLGLAVAAGLLPPVGPPIIAGGAAVALLASAGAGAAVGTVAGGVIGLGVPEGEQAYYKDEIDAGRALVVIDTDRPNDAKAVLVSQGGSLRAPADTVATL
jgi:hypothetical protein